MAIQTSGTTRISNNGELQNIGSLDATTTTTIAAAAGGGAPWDGEDLTTTFNFAGNSNSANQLALAADNNKGRYLSGRANQNVYNSNPNNIILTANGTGAWLRVVGVYNNNNNAGSTSYNGYSKSNTGASVTASAYRVTNTAVDHTMMFEGYLPAGGNLTTNSRTGLTTVDVLDD